MEKQTQILGQIFNTHNDVQRKSIPHSQRSKRNNHELDIFKAKTDGPVQQSQFLKPSNSEQQQQSCLDITFQNSNPIEAPVVSDGSSFASLVDSQQNVRQNGGRFSDPTPLVTTSSIQSLDQKKYSRSKNGINMNIDNYNERRKAKLQLKLKQ